MNPGTSGGRHPDSWSTPPAQATLDWHAAARDRDEAYLALGPVEMTETAYLLGNPGNAERLAASIDNLEAGGGTVHDLVDPDGPANAEYLCEFHEYDGDPKSDEPCRFCGRSPEEHE
jgi:hypothetical protein